MKVRSINRNVKLEASPTATRGEVKKFIHEKID
jgi:hypothetical protein